MLIYLNRTGYNGLFRLNARGAFNVPAGRYDRPKIADRAKLRASPTRSAGPACAWSSGRSSARPDAAEAGDFLYIDPPYAPLSRDVELHGLHGAALRRRRSAAAAADR